MKGNPPTTMLTNVPITDLSGLSIDLVRGLLDPLNVEYNVTVFPAGFEDDGPSNLKSVASGVSETPTKILVYLSGR